MIASEYKNCFWNASGDLSCPTPGYAGPDSSSDYPNWKLYNNVKFAGVEAYNNKGYQTDYDLAHLGTRTTDHYYNLEPIQPMQRNNLRGGAFSQNNPSRGVRSARGILKKPLNTANSVQIGRMQGGSCAFGEGYCPTSPGINKYTAYKYPSVQQRLQPMQTMNQLYNNQMSADQLRWHMSQTAHCEQQFGGNFGTAQAQVQASAAAAAPAAQYASDYDASIFKRPNMHGFGGAGWGDAQIIESGRPADDYAYDGQDLQRIHDIQDPANVNNGYYYEDTLDNGPNSYVGPTSSPPKARRLKQGKLTSYSYQISNPEDSHTGEPGRFESRYDVPTYVNDYYENCDQPNPAQMTARQQYDNMLTRYNDPAYSTNLGYPNTGQNMNMGSYSDMNMSSPQVFSNGNQFQVTNNPGICYGAYNKKDQEPIQAPNYASLMMYERPYLNPNPYGIFQLPESSNSIVPYNAVGGSNSYSSYNSTPSTGTGISPYTYQGNQRAGGGSYPVSRPTYGSCPGQELLSQTDMAFKERLLKMLGEIGEPNLITKSKNGNIRAIWHGNHLRDPYKKAFHRVYLNHGDSYPVMTVSRINPLDENTVQKLHFICDRFKVVPGSSADGYVDTQKAKKGKKSSKIVDSDESLLILRGPSYKSNLAKSALALSAIKGKITFCKICDEELGKKWVWALNPVSQKYYDPKAKKIYSKICSSLARN